MNNRIKSAIATVSLIGLTACGAPAVDTTDDLLQGDGPNAGASPGEGLYMDVLDDFLPPDAGDAMISKFRTLPDVFCQRLRSGTQYELSEAVVTKTFVDAGMSLRSSQKFAMKLHYAGARWKCPELIPPGLFG